MNKDVDIYTFIPPLGAFLMICTIIISIIEMIMHIKNNNNILLRKYILRILFMPPIYCIQAWFGLLLYKYAKYFDLMRQVSLLFFGYISTLSEYI